MGTLERIQAPKMSNPCLHHPDTPAQFNLGSSALCNFCAENTLKMVWFASDPDKLPEVDAMLKEVTR